MSFRNMGDADVLALANFLRDNTTVTSLKLDYCSICTAGARALAEALNVNTTLTTLHLGGNDIGAEGAVVLSEVLRVNTTLTTLYLGGNEIGSKGAVALSKALLGNTTLTTLDLNLNFIGAEGAVALAEALLGNTTLTTLDLNHNRIGAEGTVALANALKFNTKLRTLCLLCAVPDTYAAAELADALKFNTTLTNLIVDFYSYVYSTLWGKFSDLLKRNRLLELQSFAEASLDLLVRHSPALKGMGVTTDVLPVLAQQLSTEVLAVFEQEWKEAFRAPPPPITTTTTNTTTTTTTTTTTDATIPLTLTTSPAPIVTSPASVPPVSTQPIATAAEINALQADPNPVVALSRWIDGHANPAAALNWVDSANGYTLLHYAVVAQQGAVVRNLLTRGIDRTKADQNNQTAAQLAQQLADSSSSQPVRAIPALFN
jgi:Ran GTPase-activating protein (RanGAP) involved in mRNA processing and transport